ncbi:MAG: hypothetical protein U9R49_13215, partial [Bacteroidota bacterium]|nr:hypothetical protein [Bacteroidota bacterium]
GLVCISYLNKEQDKALEQGIHVVKACKELNIKTWQSTLLTIIGAIHWYRNNKSESDSYWAEASKVSRSISERREANTTLGIEMCKKDPFWIPQ